MKKKVTIDEPKMYKFVGISFDENYKEGQDELNRIMCQGYEIIRDYQTSAGVVFSLKMNGDSFSDEPKQRSITEYLTNTVKPEMEKMSK
ncbi:MAG: hypothetical protein CXT78_02905 [Thaumarchaeota archaeon]|jgi:trans-2-enoyl-CoA reductase|nr:MAG: hypothetical protein CXT78_02905 [Nitrososphaerota archaeon]